MPRRSFYPTQPKANYVAKYLNPEDRPHFLQDDADDLQTTSSERPMAHSNPTTHLNGSSNQLAIESEENKVAIPFLKAFWPHILSVLIALICAAYASGYIQTPATRSSVEDLKNAFLEYRVNHDKIDNIHIQEFSKELSDIKTILQLTSDRTRNIEINLAELKGHLNKSPSAR